MKGVEENTKTNTGYISQVEMEIFLFLQKSLNELYFIPLSMFFQLLGKYWTAKFLKTQAIRNTILNVTCLNVLKRHSWVST